MNPRRAVLAWVMIVAACAGACERSAAPGPPELRLGRDECAECGMSIVEERSAAALIVDRGAFEEALLFDDIGDMLDYERKRGPLKVTRRYVHDYGSSQWIRAEPAWYVRADAIHTPMGSGLAAFESRAAAEEAGRAHGVGVMDFAAVGEDRAKQFAPAGN